MSKAARSPAHRYQGDQPCFDTKRLRDWTVQLSGLPAADRAAAEGVVLRIVSTILLHHEFRISA